MGSRRILLVDDDVETTSEVSGLLSAWEQEVSWVGNPNAVRASLMSNRPDLVLANIRLCRDIRHRILPSVKELCPRASVVLLGPSDTPENEIRALELGGTRFVQLPASPDAIFDAVRQGLDRAVSVRQHGEIVESLNTLRNVLVLHTKTLERLASGLAHYGDKATVDKGGSSEDTTGAESRERAEHRQVIRELKAFVSLLMDEIGHNNQGANYQSNLKALIYWLEELDGAPNTQSAATSALSEREMQIFAMINAGMTSEQAAERLHISPDTVKTHRRNIRRKLGITGRKDDPRRSEAVGGKS